MKLDYIKSQTNFEDYKWQEKKTILKRNFQFPSLNWSLAMMNVIIPLNANYVALHSGCKTIISISKWQIKDLQFQLILKSFGLTTFTRHQESFSIVPHY